MLRPSDESLYQTHSLAPLSFGEGPGVLKGRFFNQVLVGAACCAPTDQPGCVGAQYTAPEAVFKPIVHKATKTYP